MAPIKWESMKGFMSRLGIGRARAWELVNAGLPVIQIGGKGRRIKIDPAAADIWLIQRYGKAVSKNLKHEQRT